MQTSSTDKDGGIVRLTAVLAHASGECISSVGASCLTLKVKTGVFTQVVFAIA